MEPFEAAGWLSLLPPIIAITLALLTKEVISSLFLGILSGTIIHTIGTGTGPLLVKPVETAFAVMVSKLDFNIILFCTLLGALVYVIAMAGGTRAYGKWATRHIKSRRSAMLSTTGLGVFIFIDDYFNCLTVGTVMRPVTDSFRISRAKLAYIIDATAAPICIIAPISSWAAAVGSNLKATGAFESDFAAFVSTIPYNFYALLSLVMVVMVCMGRFDFGPMRKAEEQALKGDVGASGEESEELPQTESIGAESGEKASVELKAGLTGRVIPISEVPDEVFSQCVMGNGIAIEPESDTVVSPADAEVGVVMADTGHACGLVLDNGAELLIHVGIDTVDMGGDGFELLVKEGEAVKQGQPLIRFDPEKIRAAGHPTVTVFIVTDEGNYETAEYLSGMDGKAGETTVIRFA